MHALNSPVVGEVGRALVGADDDALGAEAVLQVAQLPLVMTPDDSRATVGARAEAVARADGRECGR